MDLKRRIQRIQRELGLTDDGIVGPLTIGALEDVLGIGPVATQPDKAIDDRTAKNIQTLLDRAREPFEKFALLAKATAATMGCDYVAISGTRSMEAQQALYDQGRTKPGKVVTNAKPGTSWHNFGVALDFGVFKDGRYLDSEEPELARRVHIACSKHAEDCGLTWGGSWESFKDIPHYQFTDGYTLAEARQLHKEGKWA